MISLEQTAQQVIQALKRHKVSGYEISLSASSGVSTAVRLGKVETLEYHLDKSLDINVYLGQAKGHTSSVDLSEGGILKAVESACLIAKYTQNDPFSGLAPKELMAFDVPDLDMYYPWELDPSHSIDLATRCEAQALDHGAIDNSDGAEVSSYQGEGLYANSNGMMSVQKGARHSLNWVGDRVAKLAISKLGARSLASQKCPVIFSPRVSSGLFSQLIGALSGASQYKKATFLLDSIDKLILPESISILEKPFSKKTIGAKAFDRDGVLKRQQYFVENGQVKSYVLSQYSANQLGLKTTANSGGVNNLIIEHQFTGDLDDMIKLMNKGLVVTELMGQGVNGTTGDYSRGATGFWVENGEIQYPVSGITIAGNLKDMLLGIEHVGTDVDYRGNIKVGSVLINQMTIAGDTE